MVEVEEAVEEEVVEAAVMEEANGKDMMTIVVAMERGMSTTMKAMMVGTMTAGTMMVAMVMATTIEVDIVEEEVAGVGAEAGAVLEVGDEAQHRQMVVKRRHLAIMKKHRPTEKEEAMTWSAGKSSLSPA